MKKYEYFISLRDKNDDCFAFEEQCGFSKEEALRVFEEMYKEIKEKGYVEYGNGEKYFLEEGDYLFCWREKLNSTTVDSEEVARKGF